MLPAGGIIGTAGAVPLPPLQATTQETQKIVAMYLMATFYRYG